MTKTKKQLRAEAVESPEVDAVERLRDMATKPVCRVDAPEVDVRGRLSEIADMVERDYVRREVYEVASELCGRHAARIAELEAGRGRRGNNLTWLYEEDMLFKSLTRWFTTYAGRAGDDMEADAWLMTEHGAEVIRNANKYNFEPESATESYTDTREKLLEDANSLAVDYWDRTHTWGNANDFKRDVIALLDRQAAIAEREWNRAVVRYQDERDKAMRDSESFQELYDDVLRQRDGLQARVDELGDERDKLSDELDIFHAAHDELQAKVDALEADDARAISNLANQLKNMTGARDHWKAKYESIAPHASDGEPIAIGQTLYGLSDGRAWTVDGFDRKRPWSVWAHDAGNPGKHKCLKPEWLTHEEPDSFGRIVGEMRSWGLPSNMSVTDMKVKDWAERIEKLGGKA